MRWFYSLFFFSLSIGNIIKVITHNLNKFYSNLYYDFFI
nr:MAG TPA: Sterol regulatory element-binding protein 1 complex, PROTEIN TRANSPORT.4A [Caudoviricetes sp.]